MIMADDQTQDDSAQTQPKNNDDLLAELRAKTARLAEQVHGHEGRANQTLHIDTTAETDDSIIEALRQNRPDQPITKMPEKPSSSNPAVELVRDKLARLYKKEPDASEEVAEAYAIKNHRSKHQQYMYDLTTSGKSLADIQTEWHHYYVSLPDDEKHQVWQEFYENQSQISRFTQSHSSPSPKSQKTAEKHNKVTTTTKIEGPSATETRTVSEIKEQLLNRVSAGGKLTPMHHVKSLMFGLSLAAFVGLVVTFTFFNEVFIAPFISPSRSVSATPIIGSDAGEVGPDPKIIIPKINLEVPVVYNLGSIDEKSIQSSLEQGVVHYATTPNPGEQGNVVIVGHSSNNILNSGKYKFAFVLLKRLEAEDVFFVQKDGKRYTYKVYKKEVVSPDNTSVLGAQDRPNTITLITCDPPGTSINRLIITAEQIDPDPAGNTASTALQLDSTEVEQLPSNAPSLWSRIWPF